MKHAVIKDPLLQLSFQLQSIILYSAICVCRTRIAADLSLQANRSAVRTSPLTISSTVRSVRSADAAAEPTPEGSVTRRPPASWVVIYGTLTVTMTVYITGLDDDQLISTQLNNQISINPHNSPLLADLENQNETKRCPVIMLACGNNFYLLGLHSVRSSKRKFLTVILNENLHLTYTMVATKKKWYEMK